MTATLEPDTIDETGAEAPKRRWRRKPKATAPVRPKMSTGVYVDESEPEPWEAPQGVPAQWGPKRPYGGRLTAVDPGTSYLSPTTQACGLGFAFVVGAGAPRHGVPLGHHLLSGETVSVCPHRWLGAGLVKNPTVAIIGEPGTGKSALGKRLLIGQAGQGVRPIVAGDIKPEYREVVRALDGQVITLGKGGATLNPLDPGPIAAAAERLKAKGHSVEAAELRTEAHARRLSLLEGLCLLAVPELSPGERIVLNETLNHGAGSLGEVITMLRDPAPDVLLDATTDDALRLRQIIGTLSTGALAGVFAETTSVEVDLDAPALELDISTICHGGDNTAIAAAMLATWTHSMGLVAGQLALSAHGLEPRRNYSLFMDEAWQALRGSPALVDAIDRLTRVSRSLSMAQIMTFHSLQDLEALTDEAARVKAMGLIEKCGTVILGAVSAKETKALSAILSLSTEEKELLASWRGHASWDGAGGRHLGRGKFLVVTPGRFGLPIEVDLLPQELELFNTDAVVA